MGGMDIDVGLLGNLKRFIEDECMVGLCLMEQGSALTNKHFQMVVKGNFSSLPMLNIKKLRFVWDGMSAILQVMLCPARG